MITFPQYKNLPINILSLCFDNVTNSYKFYWFLSILDHLKENNQLEISIKELSLRMISLVWYPLDYFHLSFGKEDSFKKISTKLSKNFVFDHSTNSPPLFNQIEEKLSDTQIDFFYQLIYRLVRYVPYRFLRPFFGNELKSLPDGRVDKKIKELANFHHQDRKVFYFFNQNNISIIPEWAEYFSIHQKILRDFIKWNLILFLQKNNPNVIGLSHKLEKPVSRNLKSAVKFWKYYLEKNECKCIYSGQNVTKKEISIDHFLPWSFVVHDLMWNLIPTFKYINSSKGDSLPDFNKYFPGFVKLQFDALKFYYKSHKEKLLEDYIMFFQEKPDKINSFSFEEFSNFMGNYYKPTFQVAKNMGFSEGWTFNNYNAYE